MLLSRILYARVRGQKALTTGYFLKDGIKMMLFTCLRVLNMNSVDIP